MLNTTFDWDEVDSLITLLQANGISYLVGNGVVVNEDNNIEPVHLLQRLESIASDGRLRMHFILIGIVSRYRKCSEQIGKMYLMSNH